MSIYYYFMLVKTPAHYENDIAVYGLEIVLFSLNVNLSVLSVTHPMTTNMNMTKMKWPRFIFTAFS